MRDISIHHIGECVQMSIFNYYFDLDLEILDDVVRTHVAFRWQEQYEGSMSIAVVGRLARLRGPGKARSLIDVVSR